MKLKLRHKVTGLALFSALLPAIVLALLIFVQERKSTHIIGEQLDAMVAANLDQTTRDIYNLCANANDLVQLQVDAALGVADHLVKEEGGLRLGAELVRWNAVNQLNDEKRGLELPEMLLGEEWLGQNVDAAKPTALVDAVRDMVGGTATIFQRMNEEGDMLRVATNVLTLEGDRAIGTYIPAVDPDGTPNAVVSTVMRGDTYQGSAFVVNSWYLAAYEPVYDSRGEEIIGMLYVGVKRESVDSLRRALSSIEVGETGYAWIMPGQDKMGRGRYEFFRDGAAEMQDISRVRDIDGRDYIEDIRKKAIRLQPGEVGTEDVAWQDASGNVRYKEIHYAYFKPWDWVVGVTAFEREFDRPHQEVAHAFTAILKHTLIGAIATLVVVGLLATVLGGWIARPITYLTNISELVAEGRLGQAASQMEECCQVQSGNRQLVHQQDETGQLFRAILKMIRNLNALVGGVRDSSRQLAGTATEMTDTARAQEGTVQDFGSSSSEIAAAVKEISSTSQELSQTMNKVSESARNTAGIASAGRSHLEEMREGSEGLETATRSITGKLSVIAERAQAINAVVTTIAKVADQTNLLSLNAAIEAEKAGEYGLGFAVVAREIRRLADQTAVATQDIEQMVKEMQSSVSAGVMEMDKFNEAVRTGIDNTAQLSGQMENIIEQVEALTPRFDSVREGMSSQAVGASQISEAVANLNLAAHQTSASLQGFKNTTDKLNRAVQAMQDGIARFRMDGDKPASEEEPS
ncbi:methyl-accepting chemotaxis protein [Ruficoccus amylovorans]|uniref:Methyl-accepting chemotaxis protein n=1 Tax=Ruficoccus amylovorans TaxID=1804625 RepID=A0A842HE82_9BACT|nr:methyl-accepting chemotaxis protein [Ruficoccus amylovorans]MBC2594530.1 methyl-accepting chemotaxis protein [Ruficoccus amylovorans]